MTLEKTPYFSKWLIIFTILWLFIFLNCFDNPLELFKNNWPLIFVGVLGAIIGNMTAIGGGIIFIPVLMFVYKVDPVSALKLAFVTQAVGMTSGASGWLQRKSVPLELLKWTVPPLIIGTMFSTFIVHPTPILVKSVFGPVSLLVGLLVLITLNKTGGLDKLPKNALIPIIFVSLIGGIITGWVAIGEGEIIAASCMILYSLKPEKSIGLGVVLLSINSILLALLHSLYFGGVPWDLAIFTILGVLWGGRMGAFISTSIPPKSLKKFFGVIAIVDGAVVIFQVTKVLLHL